MICLIKCAICPVAKYKMHKYIDPNDILHQYDSTLFELASIINSEKA